ncbi:probable 30S ribosomal protein S16 [Coccomyxa sp. Obi]|nr:probable 30S ribosomal protein S16 [Coccomyxa sp. Obi]
MIVSGLACSSSGLGSVANLASTECLQRQVSQKACLRQPTLQIENRVAIRFQRFGRKKSPFYRLVAIDSRSRRDGRPLERLGHYDPLKKETNLNAPAIKKWLDVGAVPSDTVRNLLKKAMVIE